MPLGSTRAGRRPAGPAFVTNRDLTFAAEVRPVRVARAVESQAIGPGTFGYRHSGPDHRAQIIGPGLSGPGRARWVSALEAAEPFRGWTRIREPPPPERHTGRSAR